MLTCVIMYAFKLLYIKYIIYILCILQNCYYTILVSIVIYTLNVECKHVVGGDSSLTRPITKANEQTHTRTYNVAWNS